VREGFSLLITATSLALGIPIPRRKEDVFFPVLPIEPRDFFKLVAGEELSAWAGIFGLLLNQLAGRKIAGRSEPPTRGFQLAANTVLMRHTRFLQCVA
jgi:hypothetical protein